MPENLVQSRLDVDAYGHLASKHPAHVDWEITVLFYSSYHRVRDRLNRLGMPKPNTHKEMTGQIRRKLPEISKPYEMLLEMSWKARYRGRHAVSDCAETALECHNRIEALLDG